MQETINKADCKTLTEPILKMEEVTKTLMHSTVCPANI